jgi:hypothetical protein
VADIRLQAVDGQDDAALRAEQRLQPPGIGRGQGPLRTPNLITEMGPMVVITGECPSSPGFHAARVRHRILPVVFGEGTTTREAAEDLVRKLMRESSSVSGWHLTDLERVIADIRAFLDPSPEPSVALRRGS